MSTSTSQQTLGYDQNRTLAADPAPNAALDRTLAAEPARAAGPGQTLALEDEPAGAAPPAGRASMGTNTLDGRASVLPRVEQLDGAPSLVPTGKARYEKRKLLGAGGMGEVALVHDHDIDRTVAVKQLLPEAAGPAGLARFIDEIRTVGQLEHPNIVPIHDVGIDANGRYFFVMKYVEGETLEDVIEKLDKGDAEYHRRFTFERRVELFMGILRALRYAHAHGVLHRDIKPANVIVGRYGEVMLMDWGVARPIERRATQSPPPPALAVADAGGSTVHDRDLGARASTASERDRMYRTRHGTLIGTPAYMSPEQARGRNDALDERSDLYSAFALFFELLTLRHYLGDVKTVGEMLVKTIEGPAPTIATLSALSHPAQETVPAELKHLLVRGLAKAPDERFGSTDEVLEELQAILEGRCRVQCHATMTKRMYRELGRFADRKPALAFFTFVGSVALMLTALALTLHAAVR